MELKEELTPIAVTATQAARLPGSHEPSSEGSPSSGARDSSTTSVYVNGTIAPPQESFVGSVKPSGVGDQPDTAIDSQSTPNASGDSVLPLSPPDRKAKPSMGKRSGQSGTIVRKGNWWHLRYLKDTPDGRIYKSVPIGRVGEITKTQAKRLGKKYLEELGINTPQHLDQALNASTFDIALQNWEAGLLPGFKPSGQQSSKYIIKKHIKPKFGGMLLEQVDKQAVQVWINELSTSGLKPKTVSNVVKLLKSVLNWSDVGTRDWRLRLSANPRDRATLVHGGRGRKDHRSCGRTI